MLKQQCSAYGGLQKINGNETAKVDDLFHLDLAYAPPYSTTKDPVHYIGMLLDKAINHNQKNAFNLSDDDRFKSV